jgi:hypothetical protein
MTSLASTKAILVSSGDNPAALESAITLDNWLS